MQIIIQQLLIIKPRKLTTMIALMKLKIKKRIKISQRRKTKIRTSTHLSPIMTSQKIRKMNQNRRIRVVIEI